MKPPLQLTSSEELPSTRSPKAAERRMIKSEVERTGSERTYRVVRATVGRLGRLQGRTGRTSGRQQVRHEVSTPPNEVYTKSPLEYFKEELGADSPGLGRMRRRPGRVPGGCRRKARRILQRYDGVLIADPRAGQDLDRQEAPGGLRVSPPPEGRGRLLSLACGHVAAGTGLGHHRRPDRRHGGIRPRQLRRRLDSATPTVILIDESHNFRNDKANRYLALFDTRPTQWGRGKDRGAEER